MSTVWDICVLSNGIIRVKFSTAALNSDLVHQYLPAWGRLTPCRAKRSHRLLKMEDKSISNYSVSLEFSQRGAGDQILHIGGCVVEAAKTQNWLHVHKKAECCTQANGEKLVPSLLSVSFSQRKNSLQFFCSFTTFPVHFKIYLFIWFDTALVPRGPNGKWEHFCGKHCTNPRPRYCSSLGEFVLCVIEEKGQTWAHLEFTCAC